MAIDLTRFYDSFFHESLESLDASEAGLLALEKEPPTSDRLNSIFRGLHSIKGAAGSLGFTALADFTHHVEGALDRMRQGLLEPTPEALDALLGCVDYSRALVAAARDGKPVDTARESSLLKSLHALERGQTPDIPVAAITETRVGSGMRSYFIGFAPHRNFFSSGNVPLRLIRALDEMGEMRVVVNKKYLPAASQFDPELCYLGWSIELDTKGSREEIAEVFSWVLEDCELAIEERAQQLSEEKPVPERRHGDRRAGDRRDLGRRGEDSEAGDEARADRLHVSRDKVDGLINLVGELVITKTMLKEGISGLTAEAALRLEDIVQQLERNTRDLQESVMAIRMLPVSHAFGRFARLVRDVGQKMGKKVNLVVTGEQSELDKSVIEKLVDPLTHLVRNALDHGIEPPAERIAAGKTEIATLKLHAEHKGGNIEIVVSDDGRGIDAGRVAAKALAAGLIHDEEEVSQERACELIFEPGFSTSDTVNELSGRGVGLDVVRRNILALSGGVKVETTPGAGSRFIIRLPLTLAIVDGMTVTVGDETYIVPMAFIAECIQPDLATLKSVAGRGMLVELRGQYLPLLKLGELIGVGGACDFERGILLVVEADGNRIALLVDALIGQEQVVIKSLETNYRKVSHIAGATILGQGQVVLILDVGALVRAARN